jgi:hypothetical protein
MEWMAVLSSLVEAAPVPFQGFLCLLSIFIPLVENDVLSITF